jgi:hypothetical protein
MPRNFAIYYSFEDYVSSPNAVAHLAEAEK